MNFWFLLQLLIDFIFITGVVSILVRMNRPAKDDPRLSKGLQLLQNKISVLEDLSDRTETQVNQLTAMLEQKVKELQSNIHSSDKQITKIEQSMQKSLEVAKIFQDKIPHGEIVERQNTIKYVKAARLAHQGLNVDEIAKQIPNLSRGEIEFIAKVNKDQLMFCEESLPEWIEENETPNLKSEFEATDFSDVDNISFMSPLPKEQLTIESLRESIVSSTTSFEAEEDLKKLSDAFIAAGVEKQPDGHENDQLKKNLESDNELTKNNKKLDGIVRPVNFPRIESFKDLN